MAARRFPLWYSVIGLPLLLLGMGRRMSWVEVGDDSVEVRMGWAFRSTIPRSSVSSVTAQDGRAWGGWGVHGWAGRWLVNGATTRIVRILLDPPARARVTFIPVTLKDLRVSVEDPQGLVDALSETSRM